MARPAGPLGVEDRTSGGTGYALTFDDGPHPQGTPAVLEILARERVSATFFLVGEQVRRNPALVREIVAAGHGIGLHCDRHRNLLRLRPSQVRADIARAQDTIEEASGRAIGLYRPPYGVLNASALRIARARALAHAAVESLRARTGRRGPHPQSIARARDRRRAARARCCSCTTPTTIPRPAPGGAPRRPFRACSRRSPSAACRPWRPDRARAKHL